MNKVKKERLDVLLVERGFFETRENAKRHIMAGIILVNDVPVDKPGTKIPSDVRLRIKGHVMPYVGRGGYKLEKAIKEFHLDLKNLVMADIGASTGGFTDCALQNGIAKVYAIDVGTNHVVLPYMYPDLYTARDLVNAGAAAVMPLASPIGSNKGLATKEFIQILIDEIDLPVIVDAGIGRPSQACEAMEMGAAAVMANTAIATAGDVPAMAGAFKAAIEAGRSAYLSGLGRVLERGASASDPLTGFLRD